MLHLNTALGLVEVRRNGLHVQKGKNYTVYVIHVYKPNLTLLIQVLENSHFAHINKFLSLILAFKNTFLKTWITFHTRIFLQSLVEIWDRWALNVVNVFHYVATFEKDVVLHFNKLYSLVKSRKRQA